jgi:hypothetical protein
MRYTGTNTTLLAFEKSNYDFNVKHNCGGDENACYNLTDKQKETIFKIVDKYKFIEGNYSSTMIQGVGHAYCDSGITSDSWATEDVEILSKYLRDEIADTDTNIFYETEIVQEIGDSIINLHTDGKRTHMLHNLFIAEMETALNNTHDIETWAEYAWDLESYMYENK